MRPERPQRQALLDPPAVFSRATAVLVVVCVLCPTLAAVDEAPAKANQCLPCHGKDGISTGPEFPNLAGQKATYLTKALRDYRSGKRQDEQMSLMAKGLSDSDITQLSEYYESLAANK